MASSKPSFPAPSEPNLRRLGVGGGGSDRPRKAQLIVLGVLVLLVVAIPLYLLRRPASSASDEAKGQQKAADPGLIRSKLDAGTAKLAVEVGEVQRVQCSSAPTRKGNEGPLCDRLPAIEKALVSAILANRDCAPRTGKSGTINYVLTIDFSAKRVHVFPGASGQWKGPQAKTAADCVRRALPEIKWEATQHRYRYYMLAVMANYPAPDPSSFPEFE